MIGGKGLLDQAVVEAERRHPDRENRRPKQRLHQNRDAFFPNAFSPHFLLHQHRNDKNTSRLHSLQTSRTNNLHS